MNFYNLKAMKIEKGSIKFPNQIKINIFSKEKKLLIISFCPNSSDCYGRNESFKHRKSLPALTQCPQIDAFCFAFRYQHTYNKT